MVTVIANKDELITPGHNGVHAGSNDNEHTFIKDYQEVDFYRSNSCKPLPENILAIIDEKSEQSMIEGTFFLQIDTLESCKQPNNNEQINDNSSLLLDLTDGNLTVKGITIESIPDLSLNTRPGSKLLLTGVISIKNGLLQLSTDNTRFQHGSNTYPRPKSAYRGRGGGSYRTSNEGRRASGNSSNRYDNSNSETNFLKGPPPKTTLMDFMTSLKLTSTDSKTNSDNNNHNENPKSRDRYRRNTEPNKLSHENTSIIDETNRNSQATATTDSNEQVASQQDENNDQLDSEDDPTHSNYRERRNPLPPRLQRAQEERTRRNTVRYYDETGYLPPDESNETYRNAATATNQSSSSSSSYSRRGDQTSYVPNNSSNMNSYTNLFTTVNGSVQPQFAYFPTNTGPVIYNLAGIPSPPFANPSSYPTDPLAFCYGAPYMAPTYLPTSINNTCNGESNVDANRELSSNVQSTLSVDDNENKSTNESQQDENQSQISSSSSVNETNANSEQSENNKQRDANSNPRPRWRIGDFCLARWNEDREFYPATIVEIHPPFCTVLFRDYNNYDQVHFSDLKVLPRDQPYYSYIPPLVASTSDFNASAASAYYPQRLAYYPSPVDGCIIMPEAPPFPFNSAGTLCMYVPPMTSVPRSNRYTQSTRRQEPNITNHQSNETTINSSSTTSKDSNDTSISNSSTVSNDDQQQKPVEQIETSSITDAPLTLVMNDDQQERSSQSNEDQLTNKKPSE